MLDTAPLFAEDGMQPEQFSARRDSRRAEHVLWGDVFAQALADLRSGAHLNQEKPQQRTRLMAEAQAWIADRSWTGVGSFPWAWTRRWCGRRWSSPPRLGTEPPRVLKVDTVRVLSRGGVSE